MLRRSMLRATRGPMGAISRLVTLSSRRGLSSSSTNPLVACVQDRTLPPFESLQVAHLAPAVTDAAAAFTRDLHALELDLQAQLPHIQWEDVVHPLEVHSDPLARMWGVVGHLMSVRNSDPLRAVHDELQQLVIETFTEAAQSKSLYDAYQAVRNSVQWESLSLAQQRVVELSLRSATLSGVALEGEAKERFNQLKLRSAELSTKFSSNLLDATKAFSLLVTDRAQLEGLPESLLQMFAQSASEHASSDQAEPATEAAASTGPWRITLDPPSYVQFMKYAANRELREQLYRASVTRASEGELNNTALIQELLAIRREMAHLLGFDSFAEVSLAEKMAPSVAEVERMHTDLRDKCRVIAEQEMETLTAFAHRHGHVDALQPWDLAYWAERLKAEQYAFTDEEVKPYFPLPKVLQGLFALTSQLFGVRIEEAPKGRVQTWHEHVQFFDVFDDRDNTLVAGFYLDPYSRPSEKNGGAWMNVCVDRSRLLGRPRNGGGGNGNDEDQLRVPVAYLICNQSPPVGQAPSLMTFREVETLFHEFGHGLQHMLTQMDHGAVAGINGVEWDAVELPSQMMENFCYAPHTLAKISGHYETGAPLPQDLFEKLRAARHYMAATQMLRQLSFGALDMYLHHDYDGQEPLFDVQKKLLSSYAVMPPLEEDRFLCSFSHIFAGGYAAGYYSYKWAEILSCDAYGAFEEAADAEALANVGRQFRATVLGRGGGQHPLEVFQAFRGREPSIAPLLTQYGLAK